MKKEELRKAIQGMNTYQFGQKKELTNKLSKVTSYVAKQEVLDMVSKLDKQIEEVKPELPVIPQWIADVIEDKDSGRPYPKLDKIVFGMVNPPAEQNTQERFKKYVTEMNKDIDDVIEMVMHVIATKKYTIEKEKLYRVELPIVSWDEKASELNDVAAFLALDITSDETRISYNANANGDYRTGLTESQIKAIDERYWTFAEEVPE